MNKWKLAAVAAMVSLIAGMGACKKSDNAVVATPKGVLYFHMHTDIDTNEVDSAMIAMDAIGRHFQLDTAEFYISGVVLHKADGATYAVSGAYALKTMAEEDIKIDSVPTGNYTSVSFNVGVDAAANQTNPATYGASSVLSVQNPSMWFGSTTQGYIFMNIAGYADTTVAQNGPVNRHFSYQLGTSGMLATVNLPVMNFTVVGNEVSFVHLIADYGKVLNGVSFKTQNEATPFVNATIATQIANNISNMIRYEE